MHKKFTVYILAFEDKNYIKIGISGVFKNRIKQIEPLWGKVNWSKSCYAIIVGAIAIEVESALKVILSSYRVFEHGEPGYTEVLSVHALPTAIQMLETYNQAPVIHGIDPNLRLKDLSP